MLEAPGLPQYGIGATPSIDLERTLQYAIDRGDARQVQAINMVTDFEKMRRTAADSRFSTALSLYGIYDRERTVAKALRDDANTRKSIGEAWEKTFGSKPDDDMMADPQVPWYLVQHELSEKQRRAEVSQRWALQKDQQKHEGLAQATQLALAGGDLGLVEKVLAAQTPLERQRLWSNGLASKTSDAVSATQALIPYALLMHGKDPDAASSIPGLLPPDYTTGLPKFTLEAGDSDIPLSGVAPTVNRQAASSWVMARKADMDRDLATIDTLSASNTGENQANLDAARARVDYRKRQLTEFYTHYAPLVRGDTALIRILTGETGVTPEEAEKKSSTFNFWGGFAERGRGAEAVIRGTTKGKGKAAGGTVTQADYDALVAKHGKAKVDALLARRGMSIAE